MKIKENHPKHFSFSAVALNGFNRQICSLDATKAIEHNDIPVKIIPANHDFFFLNLIYIILMKVLSR